MIFKGTRDGAFTYDIVSIQNILKYNHADLVMAPELIRKKFGKWLDENGIVFDFSQPITRSMTLVAQYDDVETETTTETQQTETITKNNIDNIQKSTTITDSTSKPDKTADVVPNTTENSKAQVSGKNPKTSDNSMNTAITLLIMMLMSIFTVIFMKKTYW